MQISTSYPLRYISLIIVLLITSCGLDKEPLIPIQKNDSIALIGSNLCSRMMNYGHFETSMYMYYNDHQLHIRNMCDGGDTPGFRPHSGRDLPWAFPGAEKFQTEYRANSRSEGHLASHDEWLSNHKADIICAFFGYSESFEGPNGIQNFKSELEAFIDHSLSQRYNGSTSPKLVLISPIAFEDLSEKMPLPSGAGINKNLQIYTEAMSEVALSKGVSFLDVFSPSKKWFKKSSQLTIDGSQLNDEGYKIFSEYLFSSIFGVMDNYRAANYEDVREVVLDKNWFWHNDFKIPNGVHVFGRRYEPFGPDNYPVELIKVREMTAIRDTAIWSLTEHKDYDVALADSKTTPNSPVETNYTLEDEVKYLYGEDAMEKFTVAPGYKIELFASEQEFPDLANPVQLSFDNKGRLWVACMPTYPHYKPGDSKPNDKLIILEDTDKDGKADKQTVFADNLHIPVGFEFAPEGVYVSQGTNLKLLTDTDGDDKADKEEIILSGFDDHDTHHVISAFCADPSGAIYMGEGVFLHTNVETSYGTIRATNGGFFRYDPRTHKLERTAQLSIPNPWGIAFDEWGQNFFAETSGPDVLWMMPGSMIPMYGVANHKSRNLIEADHRVRPTSGLEFVHSRHFPDDVQGSLLINNTIGFLGMKMHSMQDDGTGYKSKHIADIVTSSDPNFRPVDMEFAPDGSLYFLDWHNVLIGHMQHNARDPLRDHVHGRVYRITYPSRALVEPAKVEGATIEELLDNLKLPEYRTRYRSRRELRERNPNDVLAAIQDWTYGLNKESSNYEKYMLEALWVTWGLNQLDTELLDKLLSANDFRVRAAAIKAVRHSDLNAVEKSEIYMKAVSDAHGRVRMEAFVATSWLDKGLALPIIKEAANYPLDDWMMGAYQSALINTNKIIIDPKAESESAVAVPENVEDKERSKYLKGKAIYSRDGFCITCHQPHGLGLASSGFPPISESKWAQGNEERLIKLTLKGLHGPITVKGRDYPGQVPMTPYEGLLNDEEIAAVLTYVRSSFKNNASPISAEKVKSVRASIKDKKGFYSPAELLSQHPMQ